MTKQTSGKSKSATHPEAQRARTKSGAPGTESSKASSTAKDVRSGHDKDGNTEQRSR